MPLSRPQLIIAGTIVGVAAVGATLFLAATASHPESRKDSLHTLIVAGGPNVKLNQYAIASNARYLERITKGSRQQILFADGNKDAKSVSTFDPRPDANARKIFGWMFQTKPDFQGKPVLRSPELEKIDGPATASQVQDACGGLSIAESALVYFTGHGSHDPNQIEQMRASTVPALPGTGFVLWGGGKLKPADLAANLATFPAKQPLVLVMSQCYSGGFANLIYEKADPKGKVKDWDFCGFFSVSGDRPASGCTPEMDEIDYQDFTTHFFAALSGQSRDGQAVTGADYDNDGRVSMLEAFAWANLHDDSIDIPTNTSDYYLRREFASNSDKWLDTPLSQIRPHAAPWQAVMLDGLSTELGLKNDKTPRRAATTRADDMIADATNRAPVVAKTLQTSDSKIAETMSALHTSLLSQFPGLQAGSGTPLFESSKRGALHFLSNRPNEVAPLVKAFDAALHAEAGRDIRIAKLTRFVRVCRTIILERALAKRGTAEQRTIFHRLRAAESRNPLFP